MGPAMTGQPKSVVNLEGVSLTGHLTLRDMPLWELYRCLNNPIQFIMTNFPNTGALSITKSSAFIGNQIF